MSRVLVAGDTHGHAMHPSYIPFLKRVKRKYRCDTVVFIGDMADHETIKFHAKHTNEPGILQDHEDTKQSIAKLCKAFPNAIVCVGNHDQRVLRVGEAAGIPSVYLRDYAEVWDTPGWEWVDNITIDGVLYKHGSGRGGLNPAFTQAVKHNCSVVQGHFHTVAGIMWKAGPNNEVFGMQVGSGVQRGHRCFQYNKEGLSKAILSCGVVLDGIHPYLEKMDESISCM